MAKKKEELLIFKILAGVAVLIAIFIAYNIVTSSPLSLPADDMSEIPDLSTEGYVEVRPEAAVSAAGGLVALSGGCYRVVANTDVTQATSIINGIENIVSVRPNAHDLVKEIFDTMDIQLVMVKVVDIQENNYIGTVVVRQGDKILSLDSRPSDGIAIAVRTNSTIYFNESLLKERGEKIC